MEGEKSRQNIQSIETSFSIVHALQEIGPSRLSEIANYVDLAESTTHRHLRTLHELRYISRKGKMYQTGLRFVRLGQSAKAREPAYKEIQSHLQTLAEDTGERVQFIAEDHGLGTYLYIEFGEQAVQVGFDIGHQIHLHCSSSGKAILANYPKTRIEEIIDRWGLPSHTENTITDRKELFNELEMVQDRGYAFNREEHVNGVHGISVPIMSDETLIGAISIAGPSNRLTGDWFEKEIPDKLLAESNEVQLNIEYPEGNSQSDHIVE